MGEKECAGFLLIEIMVALGVLVMLVLCAAQYHAHMAEQRADISLYLKMTQQAGTVFEEVLANSQRPQENSYDIDGMHVSLRVRPLKEPLGQLPLSFSTESFDAQGRTLFTKKRSDFVLLDVTVSGNSSAGVPRQLHFTTGKRCMREG